MPLQHNTTDEVFELEKILQVFGDKDSRWFKAKWSGHDDGSADTYYDGTDVKHSSEASDQHRGYSRTKTSTWTRTEDTDDLYIKLWIRLYKVRSLRTALRCGS